MFCFFISNHFGKWITECNIFLQVRVGNLTKEKDMLRQVESRLSREKEAMLAEQRNQNLLLTNLKTIQVSFYTTTSPSNFIQLSSKIIGS